MLELYFKYHRVMARFRSGVLGNEIDRIAADLSRIGYNRNSAKLYLARIARFSAYAARRGCSKTKPIPPQIVDRYLRRRPTISARWAAHSAIGYAARCFPERFAARRSQKKHEPDSTLLTAYLEHLRVIRGLHQKTCEGLILAARRMLAWRRKHLAHRSLSTLTAKHVLTMTHDLLSACRSDGARSSTTAYMRSFFRYLHWANLNTLDLSHFVPRTPCWRQTHLPPRLSWGNVRRAIDAIERTTPAGIRDRAMISLLATTGLRNRELRELELEDIRWRTSEVVLRRTKGHRDRVVPLLEETGAALAEYVLHARPRTIERRVFLSHVPPCVHSPTAAPSPGLSVLDCSGPGSPFNEVEPIFYATVWPPAWSNNGGRSKRSLICLATATSTPPRSTSRSPFRSWPMSRYRFLGVHHDRLRKHGGHQHRELHLPAAFARLPVP